MLYIHYQRHYSQSLSPKIGKCKIKLLITQCVLFYKWVINAIPNKDINFFVVINRYKYVISKVCTKHNLYHTILFWSSVIYLARNNTLCIIKTLIYFLHYCYNFNIITHCRYMLFGNKYCINVVLCISNYRLVDNN